MSKKTFAALDAVAMQVGEKDAIELFQFALPLVIERQQTLERHLLAGEWAESKQCAHKAVSSVRLYGSERLEALLRMTNEVDKGEWDPAAFRQDLSEEFELVISSIREWLALHSC